MPTMGNNGDSASTASASFWMERARPSLSSWRNPASFSVPVSCFSSHMLLAWDSFTTSAFKNIVVPRMEKGNAVPLVIPPLLAQPDSADEGTVNP